MNILLPVFVSAFSLFFFLILHFLLWRFDSVRKWSVILIILLSIITYLITIKFINYNIYSHIWVSCPLYLFAIILYLNFYIGIDRSVSIRILIEILKKDNKKLEEKKLEGLYSQEYMIQSRLSLLVQKGFLEEIDGNYIPTKKGAFFAKVAILTRKIYGLTN